MNVRDLLNDSDKMSLLQELAEAGASIGVIEAKLRLRQGTLKRWLDKGKVQKSTPYRILYDEFRSFAAEARLVAEQQQLAKTPSQWLERNSSAKILEDSPQDISILSGVPHLPDTAKLQANQELLLEGIRVLLEARIPIDKRPPTTIEGTVSDASSKNASQ